MQSRGSDGKGEGAAATAGHRPRTHPVVIVVLVVGLVVTWSLALVAQRVHDSNERRLLGERAVQAGSSLTTGLPAIQTPLASAVVLADNTGGSADAFRRVMVPFVGDGRQFHVASLWRVDGPRPRRIALVGTPSILSTGSQVDLDRLMARARGSRTLTIADLLGETRPALGFAVSSSQSPVRFVVYTETFLPKDRLAQPRSGTGFDGLDYAAYLGRTTAPNALLVASDPDVAARKHTASRSVPFGDTTIRLVISPRHDLGGSLLRVLPWVIAILGSLLTLAITLLTLRLTRREAQAEQLAAENGRLYRDQRTVAQQLQASLLPDELPELPGVAFAVRYETGVAGTEVGGDWYDVVVVDDDHAILVVGDVSGRGLRAATVMASIRFAIRAYAAQGDRPADILAKVDRLIASEPDERFATVLCLGLELAGHTITIANAGHPSPVLVDRDGSRSVATKVGVPVGVGAERPYESVSVEVEPGTTLLLFTDGLFERRGESVDVGLARVRETVGAAGTGLDTMLDDLMEALRTPGAQDDTAILAIRWT